MTGTPQVTGTCTKAELVTFVNVPHTQARGRDVTIQFSLGSKVKACSQDWVGIFRSEWGAGSEPLAYQWAQGRGAGVRAVTFPSCVFERLGDLTETFLYVYVDRRGRTLGVSPRFKVAGGHPEVKGELFRPEVKPRKKNNKGRTAEAPPAPRCATCVAVSDDDEWDFGGCARTDSQHSHRSFTSDMSDIVVLSTSPSTEACRQHNKPRPRSPDTPPSSSSSSEGFVFPDSTNAVLSRDVASPADDILLPAMFDRPQPSASKKKCKKNKKNKKELNKKGLNPREGKEPIYKAKASKHTLPESLKNESAMNETNPLDLTIRQKDVRPTSPVVKEIVEKIEGLNTTATPILSKSQIRKIREIEISTGTKFTFKICPSLKTMKTSMNEVNKDEEKDVKTCKLAKLSVTEETKENMGKSENDASGFELIDDLDRIEQMYESGTVVLPKAERKRLKRQQYKLQLQQQQQQQQERHKEEEEEQQQQQQQIEACVSKPLRVVDLSKQSLVNQLKVVHSDTGSDSDDGVVSSLLKDRLPEKDRLSRCLIEVLPSVNIEQKEGSRLPMVNAPCKRSKKSKKNKGKMDCVPSLDANNNPVVGTCGPVKKIEPSDEQQCQHWPVRDLPVHGCDNKPQNYDEQTSADNGTSTTLDTSRKHKNKYKTQKTDCTKMLVPVVEPEIEATTVKSTMDRTLRSAIRETEAALGKQLENNKLCVQDTAAAAPAKKRKMSMDTREVITYDTANSQISKEKTNKKSSDKCQQKKISNQTENIAPAVFRKKPKSNSVVFVDPTMTSAKSENKHDKHNKCSMISLRSLFGEEEGIYTTGAQTEVQGNFKDQSAMTASNLEDTSETGFPCLPSRLRLPASLFQDEADDDGDDEDDEDGDDDSNVTDDTDDSKVSDARVGECCCDVISPPGCSRDGACLEAWRRSLVPCLGVAMLPRFKAKYKAKELKRMKSKKAQLTSCALYNLKQGLLPTLLTENKRTITKETTTEAETEVRNGQLQTGANASCSKACNEKGFCCRACEIADCHCNPCTVTDCCCKCYDVKSHGVKSHIGVDGCCRKACTANGYCCKACEVQDCRCNPCTVKDCSCKCYEANPFSSKSAGAVADVLEDSSIQGRQQKLKELCKFTVGSSDKVVKFVDKKTRKFQKTINAEKRKKLLAKARDLKLKQCRGIDTSTDSSTGFNFSTASSIASVRTALCAPEDGSEVDCGLSWPSPAFLKDHQAVYSACRRMMPASLVLGTKSCTNADQSNESSLKDTLSASQIRSQVDKAIETCFDATLLQHRVQRMCDSCVTHVTRFTDFLSGHFNVILAEMADLKNELLKEE